MGSYAEESLSGAVRNFPEFAPFRESSRRKALQTRGFALLRRSSRALFSGKFPDGGPNGTRWQLLWYWAIKARTKAALSAKRRRGERTGQIPVGSQLAADGRTLESDPGEQRALAH